MDNTNPLVSVIVPIYGVEAYLDECVKSIVEQTYENLEIILVDDGSNDRCPEMIDQWASRDSRIVPVHKKNGGLSSSRNAGIEVTTGDYFIFIDGDDWIEREYIKKLLIAVRKYNADIGVIGFSRVFEDGRIISEPFFIPGESVFYASPVNQAARYFFEKAIAVWGKIYSRNVIGDIRFLEGRLAEDLPFQTEVLKRVNKVAFCNASQYNYRQRSGSIARTIKPKYLYDHIRSLSEALEECEHYFPFEVEYCTSWLSALLYEYCAAKKFSEGIEDKDNLIQYAIKQCGGREKLLDNISFPESIIYYTFCSFRAFASVEELRVLQNDYRSIFPSSMVKSSRVALFLKYLPSFFSIGLVANMRDIFRRN